MDTETKDGPQIQKLSFSLAGLFYCKEAKNSDCFTSQSSSPFFASPAAERKVIVLPLLVGSNTNRFITQFYTGRAKT